MIVRVSIMKQSRAMIAKLHTRKRFEGYKDIEKQEVRQAEVLDNPKIELMKEIFKELSRFQIELAYLQTEQINLQEKPSHDRLVQSLLCGLAQSERYVKLAGLGITAEDIRSFSLCLPELYEEIFFHIRAGLMLSLMVADSKAKSFALDTVGLERGPDYLGFMNSKNISVFGDVGNNCFDFMFRGKVVVNGNAGSHVGNYLHGGSIEVKGRIASIGNDIHGGSIRVWEKEFMDLHIKNEL